MALGTESLCSTAKLTSRINYVSNDRGEMRGTKAGMTTAMKQCKET
jgi:hypothetical protein